MAGVDWCICAHASDGVIVVGTAWGPGGVVAMYVIYTMCVWVLLSVAAAFPQHVSTAIAAWGLELIDWIFIKMKDNEMRQIHSHSWAFRAENYRVVLANVEVGDFITTSWPYH